MESSASCSTPVNKDRVTNVQDSTPGGSSTKRKRGRPRKNVTPQHNDGSDDWKDHSIAGTLPDACTSSSSPDCNSAIKPKKKVGRPPKIIHMTQGKSDHSGNSSGKSVTVDEQKSYDERGIVNLVTNAQSGLVSQCAGPPSSSESSVARKRGRPKKIRNDELTDGIEGTSDIYNSRKTPVSKKDIKEGQPKYVGKKASLETVSTPIIGWKAKTSNGRESVQHFADEHSQTDKLLDKKMCSSQSVETVSDAEMQQTPTLKKRGRPRKLTSAEHTFPAVHSASLETRAHQQETPQQESRTATPIQIIEGDTIDSQVISRRSHKLGTSGQCTPSDSAPSDLQSQTEQQRAVSNPKTPESRKRTRPKKLETVYILGERTDVTEKQTVKKKPCDIVGHDREVVSGDGNHSDYVASMTNKRRGRPKKGVNVRVNAEADRLSEMTSPSITGQAARMSPVPSDHGAVLSNSEEDNEDDMASVNTAGSARKKVGSSRSPADMPVSNRSRRKSRHTTKQIMQDNLVNSEESDFESEVDIDDRPQQNEAANLASKRRRHSQPAREKVKKKNNGSSKSPADVPVSNRSRRKSRQTTKQIMQDNLVKSEESEFASEVDSDEKEAVNLASKRRRHSQPAREKVKKKTNGPFTCVHCSSILESKDKMTTHMLREHFRTWSNTCPEGVENISKYVRVYKKITCKDCEKTFRFASYYRTHLKWCGRENELAKCAECGSVVKAMWFHLHVKNHAKKNEDMENAGMPNEKKKVDHNEGKRKRGAAKRAMATIKSTWADNQNDESENSDNDEYKMEGKESSSEDEGDEEISEGPEENEKKTPMAKPVEQSSFRGSSWKHIYPGAPQFPPRPTVWKDAEEMTYKERKSLDSLVVLPLWLPSVTDWLSGQLSNSEADAYLPQTRVSDPFRIIEPGQKTNKNSKRGKNTSETSDIITDLRFPDSRKLSEGHTLFVGGPIWALDWMSHPTDEVPNQYLAVYAHRSFEHKTMFDFCGTGNTLIQLWNCGELQNERQNTEQGKPNPTLEAAIACDRGIIQDLKWCPHGAYSQDTGRLGLLAAATSCGQICVYSVPMLDRVQKTSREEPGVFKISPTAILSQSVMNDTDTGCMCVSWYVSGADTRMAAGFMDGTISIWDLATTSSLLLNQDSKGLLMIWPIQSFWAHTGPVVAAIFGAQHPYVVMSASHDRNQKAWDLRDPDQPLWVHTRTKLHTMACTPFWPVSYVGGDDCYTLSTNCVYVLDCINTGLIRSMSGYNIGIPCIWDISYSPWFHNIAVCDVTGTVVCTLMYPCAELYKNKKDLNKLKVPLMTTKEVSLFSIEEKDDLQEKSSIEEEDLNSETAPRNCLEYTFPKYPKDMSGTVFKVDNVDITKASRRSVHKVVHNPNASSYMWIAFGSDSGLLFIRPLDAKL